MAWGKAGSTIPRAPRPWSIRSLASLVIEARSESQYFERWASGAGLRGRMMRNPTPSDFRLREPPRAFGDVRVDLAPSVVVRRASRGRAAVGRIGIPMAAAQCTAERASSARQSHLSSSPCGRRISYSPWACIDREPTRKHCHRCRTSPRDWAAFGRLCGSFPSSCRNTRHTCRAGPDRCRRNTAWSCRRGKRIPIRPPMAADRNPPSAG